MTKFPVHLRWVALSLLVALAYLFGLGGDHIPRNGDELVYANIARLTAATGDWLPLQSAWDFMRNTKPPLLFWQAMVAGGWGDHWTLLNLRLPSIAYTWAITLMVGLLTWRMAKAAGTDQSSAHAGAHPATLGAIAALVYLSFFTTYRYGRPYVTSAPETFWLCGIFLALAWSPVALLASKWKFPLLAAVALGIGCLYKSFAMVVPVGFGLALCYQVVGANRAPWAIVRPGIVFDAIRVAVICLIALGIFGLWFAIDPLPGEVWREFVVGENAGKFKSSPGYFKVAFSGTSGFFTILTGYFSNALFLLPVSIGCAVAAFKSWRQGAPISAAEKVLWLWMLALMLVFLLPNQRSTRYLIAAMPALAIVMALYWHRIGRGWFIATLVICAVGAVAMGWIAYAGIRATGDTGLYSPLIWVYLLALLAVCSFAIFRKTWTRPVSTTAAFSVLLALAGVTQPFNGDLARFKPESLALLQGQTVAVPSNFNGHFERYEFIIPGAKVVDYFAEQPVDVTGAEVDQLLQNNRYVLVQRRLGTVACTACRVVDERWDLRSRQKDTGGSMAAFKTPQTYWFAKEYLIERLAP
jgi:4-amino-4-deoxy-L-arabinose transferase-like glycosyltransferase